MSEKNGDLGLSLSLKWPENHPPPPVKSPFPLNLIHRHHLQNHQQLSFFLNLPHPADLDSERGVSALGIDVNRTPATSTAAAECEEEAAVSSPNSSVSRAENGGVSADDEEEEDGGDAAARKKLRLSKDQAAVLEETFKEHNTLNPKQKVGLAKQLELSPRQVEVWFQNRRARTKLKRTEVDCEYLKRCCETLTEENKRLQKEVNDLRALKLSPQFYMNNNPPTTLTMCPQCERVATFSPLGTNRRANAHHGSITSGSPKTNYSFLPRTSIPPPSMVKEKAWMCL